jgi:hypothetical protein
MSTPQQRILSSQIANLVRWSREPDKTAATAPARRGRMAKYEAMVDPDGVLPANERAARAEMALKADMLRLAAKSARVRAARKARAA